MSASKKVDEAQFVFKRKQIGEIFEQLKIV